MSHYKDERTLVVIKPDGIQRSLIGEIIKRYERVGLKLVGMKMVVPTLELMEKHYTVDPEWVKKTGEKRIKAAKENGEDISDDPLVTGGEVLDRLKNYMSCGPVVAMVWQGAHAVDVVRKITGGTEPRTTDVGTIRGDLILDSYAMSDGDGRAVRNLVHASGNLDDAPKEIDLWFDEKELTNYRLVQEQILYDVNLDGILE